MPINTDYAALKALFSSNFREAANTVPDYSAPTANYYYKYMAETLQNVSLSNSDRDALMGYMVRGAGYGIQFNALKQTIVPSMRSNLFSSQCLSGNPSNFPIADCTGYYTERAPGKVYKIQACVPASVNTAVNFKGSFLIGAAVGPNAGSPLNSAGATFAPTPFTWGITDPNDVTNPGGGAANAAITNASGTFAAHNLVEGMRYSDWMTVTPTDRTDFPGVGNLVSVRIHSTGNFPSSNGNDLVCCDPGNANNAFAGETEFSQGYWNGDQTAANNPTVGAFNSPYGLRIKLRYILDTPGQSHCVSGDSTFEGWMNNKTTSQGAPLGNNNGLGRRVRNYLVNKGIPASYLNLARTSENSRITLRRMRRELQTGNTFTHIWIQCWSVNETLSGGGPSYNIDECLDWVLQCIQFANIRGVKKIILCTSAASAKTYPGVWPKLGAFLSNWEAQGGATLRMDDLLCKADGAAIAANFDADLTHPNETGWQIVENYIKLNAEKYGLN